MPHDSPWRLVLIGDEARQLLESDTVLKLNAPSAIKDTAWIEPGKTTFPWWNDWRRRRSTHMARAFPLYRAWGIESVMIDFMDRDDQEMVNWQRELLQLAADNQLTVTSHGVAAPTGLERTFPNLLNSEAVRNLEYGKWDEENVTPEHDVTVPLTRILSASAHR
ncbi:MAG TPA: glycoside hydrolase family 97 catalytic domain-containing protein [Steroidobacteraceae bacterium]|nr:glycoside hydrolase family 97 catalytic domain-containing protein [Steroidobacteraceae bacterium]